MVYALSKIYIGNYYPALKEQTEILELMKLYTYLKIIDGSKIFSFVTFIVIILYYYYLLLFLCLL